MKHLFTALIVTIIAASSARAADAEIELLQNAASNCGFLTSLQEELRDVLPEHGNGNSSPYGCLKALLPLDQDWLHDALSTEDLTWYENNKALVSVFEKSDSLIGRPSLDFQIDEDARPDFQ